MIRIPRHLLDQQQARPDPEPALAVQFQHWWTTGFEPHTGYEIVLYHGRDLDEARAARREAELRGLVYVRIRDGGCTYPRPADAPGCRCKERQFIGACLYGHADTGECHYPVADCAAANCAHAAIVEDGTDDVTALLERRQLVLPTDRYFADSPDAGSLACVCSRCGRLCADEPVRVHDVEAERDGEWRYCGTCFRG